MIQSNHPIRWFDCGKFNVLLPASIWQKLAQNKYFDLETLFAAMVQDKHIHHFITFGVPFSRIKLDIAMDRYHPVRFFGINFLMADSLPTIEADQNLKRRLWGALQQVFLGRD